MPSTSLSRPLIAAALALTLAGCGATTSSGDAEAKPSPTTAASAADDSSSPTVPGAYLTKAEYDATAAEHAGTTVVLFFHAPWCPDCKDTDASLKADGVPDGLTVVKVDYDTMNDLKKKYGITQQHTFVQIDGDGDLVKKWTGTTTGTEIKAQIL